MRKQVVKVDQVTLEMWAAHLLHSANAMAAGGTTVFGETPEATVRLIAASIERTRVAALRDKAK